MESQEEDNESNNDDNSETEGIDAINQKISEEETASSVAESEEHKTTVAIRGSNSSKGTWSSEEDALLLFLMNSGFTSWTDISRSMSGRNSKQCRERWTEYVDPTLDRGKFTKEEDEIILREQQRVGNRWTAIAEVLPTKRTATAVKVRYNSLLRKQRKDTYITHYAPNMISLGGSGGPGGGGGGTIYHPEFFQFASHLESSQPQPHLQAYPPLPPHFLHRIPMLPGPGPGSMHGPRTAPPAASHPSQYFPSYHILPPRSHLPRLPLTLQQQHQQQQQHHLHNTTTTTIPVPMRYPPPMSIARGHPYIPFHPFQARPPPSSQQPSPQYYYTSSTPPPLQPPYLPSSSSSSIVSAGGAAVTSSDYYEDYPPQPYDHMQLLSQPPWQMLIPDNQGGGYYDYDTPPELRESYESSPPPPSSYYTSSEAENDQLYYQTFPPNTATNTTQLPYPQPLLWYPSHHLQMNMNMSSNTSSSSSSLTNRIRNNTLVIKNIAVGSKRSSSETQDSSGGSSSDQNLTDNQSSDNKTNSNSNSIGTTRSSHSSSNNDNSVRSAAPNVHIPSQIISNLLGEKIDESLKRRKTENRNDSQIIDNNNNSSNSEYITDLHLNNNIISHNNNNSSVSDTSNRKMDADDFEKIYCLGDQENDLMTSQSAASTNLTSSSNNSSITNRNNVPNTKNSYDFIKRENIPGVISSDNEDEAL